MREFALGLITFSNPAEFLLARNEQPEVYRSIQHRCELDPPCKGTGKQVKRRGSTTRGTEIGVRGSVPAKALLPFIKDMDARLIHSDVPPPRARWKIEFRGKPDPSRGVRGWPDDASRLDATRLKRLHGRLDKATLQVNGLWINPSDDPDRPPEWVNLVLGPIADPTLAQAKLEIRRDREGYKIIRIKS